MTVTNATLVDIGTISVGKCQYSTTSRADYRDCQSVRRIFPIERPAMQTSTVRTVDVTDD
jgi:hypothetical protein